MMARMLSQLPLPLLPPGAAEIAPGVGLLTGEDGGLVAVHGLATFAWDAGDEAGRGLAAARPVRLRAGAPGPGAAAVVGDPATGRRGGAGGGEGAGRGAGEPLRVLPDPVPRDGERVLARWGCSARALSRCSSPVPGTRWPACCWPCPPWRPPGCWKAPARSTAGSAMAITGWPPHC